MKKFPLFFLLLAVPFFCEANFSVYNTGINDNFNGIWFWSAYDGVLTGNNGVYYTNNALSQPTVFTRFRIMNNTADSLLYERCSFHKVSSSTANLAYIAATDTVLHQAIIFRFHVITHSYAFTYIGPANTALNWIEVQNPSGKIAAVGDNGFCVYGLPTALSVVNTGTTTNLKGVTFYNSTTLFTVSDSVFYRYTEVSGILALQTFFTFPGRSFSGLVTQPGTIVTTGDNILSNLNTNNGSSSSVTLFDLGLLHVRDVSQNLVATDHGVFKNYSNNHLEYFPNTTHLVVNDINETSGTANAACNNGYYMRLSSPYNYTKPYAQSNLTVNCLGQNCVFNSVAGGGTACTWQVNGTTVGNTCSLNTYAFNAVGQYTVSLIASNPGPYSDTVSQVVTVVDTPDVSFSVIAPDSFICHSGMLDIDVGNSENGFTYYLRRSGNSLQYGNELGTGNPFILHSGIIDSTGVYYILAQSDVSACKAVLADSLHITAEETKARIHCTYLNSATNELTLFLSNSDVVDYYAWDFGTTAASQYASVEDPVTSFTSVGTPIVKLKVWTDHNCYDSVTFNGLVVYQPIVDPDSCWAFDLPGTPPPDAQLTYPIALQSSGALIGGRYIDRVFSSRYGQSVYLPGQGAFLAKYSPDGVLKWVNYSCNGTNGVDQVLGITTDQENSIYITGNSLTPFHFNNGDSLKMNRRTTPANAYHGHTSCFVTKMDTLGRLLFYRLINGFGVPNEIALTSRGNIVVCGSFILSAPSVWIPDSLKFINPYNGNTVLFQPLVAASPPADFAYVMELDTAGNYKHITGVSTGLENQIAYGTKYAYLIANDAYGFSVYTNGSVHSFNVFNNDYFPIVQLDTAGNYIRNVYFKPTYCSIGEPAIINSITSDEQDNLYVIGYRTCTNSTLYYYNGMDSVRIPRDFRNFIAKIDSSGNLLWINGSTSNSGLETYGDVYYNASEGTISTVFTHRDTCNYFHQPMDTIVHTGCDVAFSDMIIAKYDQSGNLLVLTKAGSKTNNSFYDYFPEMAVDRNGFNYLYSYGYAYGGAGSTMGNEFGDTMHITTAYMPIVGACRESGYDSPLYVGLKEYTQYVKKGELLVYPNPAGQYFEVQIPPGKRGTLSIVSVLGQIEYRLAGVSTKTSLDINKIGLHSGVYTILFTGNDGKTGSSKIIIQN